MVGRVLPTLQAVTELMRLDGGDQGVVPMAPTIMGVHELDLDGALADGEPH
jgi:hypothetical protein